MDADRRLDLSTLDEIFCGRGDGTFADPAPLPGRTEPGNRMSPVAVADVTGDDLPDVFAYAPQNPGGNYAVLPQTGAPPPSVHDGVVELSTTGLQAIRLTGTGFDPGVEVISVGDLLVRTVTWESDTAIVVGIDVPAGIGTAPQAVMIRNPDSRAQRVEFPVRGLIVRDPRGRIVDKLAPSRDQVSRTAAIAFTELSALGDQVDVRQGLRLEFGDPEDPYVLDVPGTAANWKLKGGALPGEPDSQVVLRVRLAGEDAESEETFDLKARRNGVRRLSRRR